MQKIKKPQAKVQEVGNLPYPNKQIIEDIDIIASKILKQQGKNRYRDHFFPQLINELGLKTGAEIGVDKGEFSLHILSRSNINKYFCIDTWQDNFGSDYKPNYYNSDGNVRFQEASKTLQKFIDEQKVEMIMERSTEASNKFENDSFDFVYIDGDHSLEGIMFDLYSWVKKVRIGGIVSGHDYKDGMNSGINDYFGKQLDYAVQTAVNYYCKRYGHKLNIVGGRILSWWFVRNI